MTIAHEKNLIALNQRRRVVRSNIVLIRQAVFLKVISPIKICYNMERKLWEDVLELH